MFAFPSLVYLLRVDSAMPFMNRPPAIQSSSVSSNPGIAEQVLGLLPQEYHGQIVLMDSQKEN